MVELTVKRSASSRNPTFEPAKRQSREKMKAVKESTMGSMAASRNIVAILHNRGIKDGRLGDAGSFQGSFE